MEWVYSGCKGNQEAQKQLLHYTAADETQNQLLHRTIGGQVEKHRRHCSVTIEQPLHSTIISRRVQREAKLRGICLLQAHLPAYVVW